MKRMLKAGTLIVSSLILITTCMSAPQDKESGMDFYEGVAYLKEQSIKNFYGDIEKLAIYGFQSESESLTELNQKLTSELTMAFTTDPERSFSIMDRDSLDEALKETQFNSNQSLMKKDDVVSVGEFIPADAVLIGDVYQVTDEYRVSLKIISTETGEVVSSAITNITLSEELAEAFLETEEGASSGEITQEEVEHIKLMDVGSWGLAYKESRLYTCSPSGTIGVINLDTMEMKEYQTPIEGANGLTFVKDQLLVTSYTQGKMFFVDTNVMEIVDSFETYQNDSTAIAFDGEVIINADYSDGGVFHYFTPKGNLTKTIKSPTSNPDGMVFHAGKVWYVDALKGVLISFPEDDPTQVEKYYIGESNWHGLVHDGTSFLISSDSSIVRYDPGE